MKAIVMKATDKKAKPFPKLMESDEGTIVLFIRNGYGCVIKESNISSYLSAMGGWEMSCFHDFVGTVTLSNDWEG